MEVKEFLVGGRKILILVPPLILIPQFSLPLLGEALGLRSSVGGGTPPPPIEPERGRENLGNEPHGGKIPTPPPSQKDDKSHPPESGIWKEPSS